MYVGSNPACGKLFALFKRQDLTGTRNSVYKRVIMFDLRYRTPSSFLLAGPSSCGKTSYVGEMLRNIDTLFVDPRIKQNVVYFYNEWQALYDELAKENIVTHWESDTPSLERIRSLVHPFKHKGGSIIVIDDRSQSINDDVLQLYTVFSHHWSVVVILLCQNIFNRNPRFRELSLSSTYIFLYKNPRDSSQITYFARQFAPGRNSYIVEAFRDATEEPFGYLLFDNHQQTPNILRVRSKALPHEQPMIVYVRKTSPI